jgi:hypothetical protein
MPRKDPETTFTLPVKPIGRVTFYQTIKPIDNPFGDGRHNRANWRSPLDQTRIPAGFIFGLDDEGNIFDHSQPAQVFQSKRKGSAELRSALLSVVGTTMEPVDPPPPTIEDVLAEAPKAAIPDLLKRLGMTPEQLRKALSGDASASPAVTARAAPSNR